MEKKSLWILLFALAVGVILAFGAFRSPVLATGSWGLAFRQEGQPPEGHADNDLLRSFDASYLGNTQEKVLYLTFDAGYENGCTGKILDILAKHQVSAAFFLAGHYFDSQPDLVKRMAEEGHIVGNHTVHHYDMSKLSDKETFSAELKGIEDSYRTITGQALPRYYRPPQGIYSQENLKMARDLGYKTVFWSLAHADWDNNNQPDPEKALQKLLSRTHNGAVVLLHSTSKTNADILDALITQWKELGYRFGTLEELFA